MLLTFRIVMNINKISPKYVSDITVAHPGFLMRGASKIYCDIANPLAKGREGHSTPSSLLGAPLRHHEDELTGTRSP